MLGHDLAIDTGGGALWVRMLLVRRIGRGGIVGKRVMVVVLERGM
jgi:hypothetical protein